MFRSAMTKGKGVTDGSDSRAVTADDVAAKVGVSRWTVARAFKQDSPISPRSRKRVLQAALELGYVPDLLAASLASDKSNLVALLVDEFENPHKLVMLEYLTRALRKAGYGCLLVNSLSDEDAPEALLSASQRRVDAAVLIGMRVNETMLDLVIGARRLRKLIVFARVSTTPGALSICCDDVTAMGEIASHVIARGYRRPLFLAGPETVSTRLMRKETFLSRWRQEFGSTPPVVAVAAYSPIKAYEQLTAYFKSSKATDLPDVVVCENDALALGAVDAVSQADHRHRVTRGIGVTGFDDIPAGAMPRYSLTTYRQPMEDMAAALISVLKGEAVQNIASMRGELVVRQSTERL